MSPALPLLWCSYLLMSGALVAQGLPPSPELDLDRRTVEAHIRFLAADELGGRLPGTPGHAIAARYLATQFQAYGLQPLPGLGSYYQPVPFERVTPPATGYVHWQDQKWVQGEDLLCLHGPASTGRYEAVFVGYGWVSDTTDDYAGQDLTGKVAVALLGLDQPTSPGRLTQISQRKRQLAHERGAVALLELYTLAFPWGRIKQYFGGPSERLAASTAEVVLPHAWLHDPAGHLLQAFRAGDRPQLDLATDAVVVSPFTAPNVVGYIPGRDTARREQYLVLSAHYDHIGTAGGGPDTVYNGARDNAIGVAGLLAAAQALAAAPPPRSVIFLACTAEEMGMLGSRWFVEHPPLPLEQIRYNLNFDGAGYNDTTRLTALGYARTGIASLIDRAAQRARLGVIIDPMPEQQLFDRSDNVSFAAAGIPCLSFAPGVTEMDERILMHYHQLSDEAEGLDYAYLRRLSVAFASLARLIAEQPAPPFWQAGDPYYEAGRRLYGQP